VNDLARALSKRSLAEALTIPREDGSTGLPPASEVFNLPNAITAAGLGLSGAWLAGGSPWLGLAGLLADDLDGRVARATGQTTEVGSLLDWTADVVLTGLVLNKLDAVWALLPVIGAQVILRRGGYRLSGRAALTTIALIKDWHAKD
jgi:hypothetical protein